MAKIDKFLSSYSNLLGGGYIVLSGHSVGFKN